MICTWHVEFSHAYCVPWNLVWFGLVCCEQVELQVSWITHCCRLFITLLYIVLCIRSNKNLLYAFIRCTVVGSERIFCFGYFIAHFNHLICWSWVMFVLLLWIEQRVLVRCCSLNRLYFLNLKALLLC